MKDIISDLFEDWIFLHKKVGIRIFGAVILAVIGLYLIRL